MSNVLIGIIGVILFIGLAVAGASFFGPVVSGSIAESKANGTMQIMTTVAKSVAVRNRELEMVTPAADTASSMVPDYLSEIPTNPVNGAGVRLLNASAATASGGAVAVASSLGTSDEAQTMCAYLSRTGGVASLQTTSTLPANASGCVKASSAMGPIAANEYVAYVRIEP